MARSKRDRLIAMPRTVTVLGLDPGFGSSGYGIAQIDPVELEISRVIEVGLVEHSPDANGKISKPIDDLRRAREQWTAICQLITENDVDGIAIEITTRSQYVACAFGFGVMIGMLSTLNLPVIGVHPRQVKMATGDSRATKRDVITWALDTFGKRVKGWPTSPHPNSLGLKLRRAYVAPSAEHPADALATIAAALRSDQFHLAFGEE